MAIINVGLDKLLNDTTPENLFLISQLNMNGFCTCRKFCTGAVVPALPPGTVNGGDSGGVSLRCFGGVETMKIFLFPSFNRFANYTPNMTYNIQSHQHHCKLLRYVYFYQISTVKTLAALLL